MSLHKIIKIVVGILAVIGLILALMIMSGNEGMVDNMLYVTYLVLALILALVLVYVVKGLFAGNIKKTLLSVGAFLVILVISYAVFCLKKKSRSCCPASIPTSTRATSCTPSACRNLLD